MRRIGLAVLVACVVGIGTAFAFAVGLAVMDLYLAGHGRPALSRPWIDRPARGVHLGRADVIMLVGSAVPAIGAGIAVAAGRTPAPDPERPRNR